MTASATKPAEALALARESFEIHLTLIPTLLAGLPSALSATSTAPRPIKLRGNRALT
jgi:hypothetical protein